MVGKLFTISASILPSVKWGQSTLLTLLLQGLNINVCKVLKGDAMGLPIV